MLFVRRICIVGGLVLVGLGLGHSYLVPYPSDVNFTAWLIREIIFDGVAILGALLAVYGFRGQIRQKPD